MWRVRPRTRRTNHLENGTCYLGLEQWTVPRCLICLAQFARTMRRILAVIKDVVFRVAFGIAILVQFVLWILLWGGIGTLLKSDNFFVSGLLVTLALLGPFLVGAANYFIYYRAVREEYIPREAEKWLVEQRIPGDRGKKRRRVLKRWALWIPAASVILICTFLDYTWAFATHLFNPRRGNLIGYEVSIPLTWALNPEFHRPGDSSYVAASRLRGLWPIQMSTMNFRNVPGGNSMGTKRTSAIISERVLSFGKGTMTCWEETPPEWMLDKRYIECSTPTGDFSAGFAGSDQDAREFYRVIDAVKIH